MSTLVVPNRTLIHKVSDNGLLSTFSLSELRGRLEETVKRQAARDVTMNVCDLEVTFRGGRMLAHIPDDSVTMLFSSWAASQVAAKVLPGHFFKGLRQLATMDAQGAQLAEQVWKKLASGRQVEAVIRTVMMKIDNKVHRVVRACISPTYAIYSNAEFMDTILNNAGDYRNLPVLEWRLTDAAMRTRFVGMEDAVYGLANLDKSALENEVIPMVEAYNSEVGRGKVGMSGGIYLAKQGVGINHWSNSSYREWQHRGDGARIRRGVVESFKELFEAAKEVAAMYENAKLITIERPLEWMDQELKDALTKRVLENAKNNLKSNPNITAGGKLASVVEALSVAAKEEDLEDQEAVEALASQLMAKGVNRAENGILKLSKKQGK